MRHFANKKPSFNERVTVRENAQLIAAEMAQVLGDEWQPNVMPFNGSWVAEVVNGPFKVMPASKGYMATIAVLPPIYALDDTPEMAIKKAVDMAKENALKTIAICDRIRTC